MGSGSITNSAFFGAFPSKAHLFCMNHKKESLSEEKRIADAYIDDAHLTVAECLHQGSEIVKKGSSRKKRSENLMVVEVARIPWLIASLSASLLLLDSAPSKTSPQFPWWVVVQISCSSFSCFFPLQILSCIYTIEFDRSSPTNTLNESRFLLVFFLCFSPHSKFDGFFSDHIREVMIMFRAIRTQHASFSCKCSNAQRSQKKKVPKTRKSNSNMLSHGKLLFLRFGIIG
jgi:hypothetical protein